MSKAVKVFSTEEKNNITQGQPTLSSFNQSHRQNAQVISSRNQVEKELLGQTSQESPYQGQNSKDKIQPSQKRGQSQQRNIQAANSENQIISNSEQQNLARSNQTSNIRSGVGGAASLSMRNRFIEKFGLDNYSGHQNCFLNVILQAFWNIVPFRIALLSYCAMFPSRDSLKFSLSKLQNQSSKILSFSREFTNFYLQIFEASITVQTQIFKTIQLRKELFKFFYLDNLFNLNDKADASEAFTNILTLLHGSYQIIQLQSQSQINNEKVLPNINLDDECQPTCFVHDFFFIRSKVIEKCQCGKEFPSAKINTNNFTYLIHSISLLEYLTQSAKYQYKSTGYSFNDLSKIQETFIQQAKQSITQSNQICIDENCKIKKTNSKIYIFQPYPQILTFNLNWIMGEVKSSDILKVLISIPDKFKLNELFDEIDSKSQAASYHSDQYPFYQFKGMVCFLGGHYISYFRSLQADEEFTSSRSGGGVSNLSSSYGGSYGYSAYQPSSSWKLYDDINVKDMKSWAHIVYECVDFGSIPTLLYFQQISNEEQVMKKSTYSYLQSSYSSNDFKISYTNLKEIEERAKRIEMQSKLYNDEDLIKQQERLYRQIQQRNQKNQKNGSKGSNNSTTISLTTSTTTAATNAKEDANNLSQRSLAITNDAEGDQKAKVQYSPSRIYEASPEVQFSKYLQHQKIKYLEQNQNIYIYECNKCPNLIVFQWKNCPYCKATNYYYQEQVEGEANSELSNDELIQIKNELDLINKAKKDPSQFQSLFSKVNNKYIDQNQMNILVKQLNFDESQITDQNKENTQLKDNENEFLRSEKQKDEVFVSQGDININKDQEKNQIAGNHSKTASTINPTLKEKEQNFENSQKEIQSMDDSKQRSHTVKHQSNKILEPVEIVEQQFNNSNKNQQHSGKVENQNDLKQNEYEGQQKNDKSQPTEQITKWKCQQCNQINEMTDENCQKCDFSLQFTEDLDNCFILIGKEQKNEPDEEAIVLNQVKEAKRVDKEPEEKPLKEDEWICQECNAINLIDLKDVLSHYCKKCNTENEIIKDQIFQMKFYQKNKDYDPYLRLKNQEKNNTYLINQAKSPIINEKLKNSNYLDQIQRDRRMTVQSKPGINVSYPASQFITCGNCQKQSYSQSLGMCIECRSRVKQQQQQQQQQQQKWDNSQSSSIDSHFVLCSGCNTNSFSILAKKCMKCNLDYNELKLKQQKEEQELQQKLKNSQNYNDNRQVKINEIKNQYYRCKNCNKQNVNQPKSLCQDCSEQGMMSSSFTRSEKRVIQNELEDNQIDWVCQICKKVNESYREKCIQCKMSKPPTKQSSNKDGHWFCPKCFKKNHFKFKEYKCVFCHRQFTEKDINASPGASSSIKQRGNSDAKLKGSISIPSSAIISNTRLESSKPLAQSTIPRYKK